MQRAVVKRMQSSLVQPPNERNSTEKSFTCGSWHPVDYRKPCLGKGLDIQAVDEHIEQQYSLKSYATQPSKLVVVHSLSGCALLLLVDVCPVVVQ